MRTASIFSLFLCLAGVLGSVFAGREPRQLANKNLKVTSILSEPFLNKVADPKGVLQGNDRYEGFIKDLIDLVAKELKFTYTINLVQDGKYGAPDRRGGWTGMMGEVINNKADIAAAPLTVTYSREQAVDFTKPFMNLGVTLLMNKQDVTSVDDGKSTVFFLKPFTYSVWACLAVALALITALFYVINRFDPYERSKKHCEGKKCAGSDFGVLGSLWFVCGGLTLQGYSKRPRSAAAFVLSAIWWSFSIIIFATYIMGMVSTQARAMFAVPGLKIRSLQDLLDQNDTTFGSVDAGSTMSFFQSSSVPMFKSAFDRMARDDSFALTTDEGIDKVKKGGYAFLGESTMIDYTVRRSCDLVKVGGRLNDKSYALACQNNSPYTAKISDSLLKLRESGRMASLVAKWWKSSVECKDGYEILPDMFLPSESPKFTSLTTIDLSTSGGIFIYLVIGICVAMITLAVEIFLFKAKGKSQDDTAERNDDKKRGSQMQDIA